MTTQDILTRFQILADVLVLHKGNTQGPRIVRTQTILDNETGQQTVVSFWADGDGRPLRVK